MTKNVTPYNTYWTDDDKKLHREDGPAIIWRNGDNQYWIHGKHHRDDGPAVINNNGYRGYWVNGKKHRIDGPAIVYNGVKKYYLNDNELSKEEFDMYNFIIKI